MYHIYCTNIYNGSMYIKTLKTIVFWSSLLRNPLYLNCCYSVCKMEKAMATHSSTLAWKIPWTEEPGGLQSMRLRRVGHD